MNVQMTFSKWIQCSKFLKQKYPNVGKISKIARKFDENTSQNYAFVNELQMLHVKGCNIDK